MLSVAHVLLSCRTSVEDDVFEQLREMDDVKEVSRTIGVYNMVIKLESESDASIKETISNKIRKLSNIDATLTLVSTLN